jgi:hypothetical protein
MSLGGDDDDALSDAVTNLLNDGVTVVVASGNGGIDQIGDDACDQTPANTFGTITVNSLGVNDQDSTFSNYGPCTDIYAPGEDILSAGITSPTSTATKDGTSMATPFVAGAVARILHENPEFSRAQVIAKLFANAKPYNSGIRDDAPRVLFTPTVDDATLAANIAAEGVRLAAAAEVARLAEVERLATEKAAADKAAADKAAADKAAADKSAADKAAADKAAADKAAADKAAADKAAADKAAADKAAADKAAADKAAADKAAADKAAAVKLAAEQKAAALSKISKSLKIKVLTNKRMSISVTTPVGSKTVIQRKVGGVWKTLSTVSAVKSRVVKVRSSGTYRVQIKSTTGTVTSKTYRVK